MELPSFDLLWAASEKLAEFESALDELDHNKLMKQSATDNKKRQRKRYGGLYGVGFESQNKEYYTPIKNCCDDSFYTEQEYQRHLDSHIKCSFEECPFVSHPKLMRVHKEVVHDGGLFQHIYRSSSDKAVQQWRETRKRNYPTVERVEAKQKLILERIERGELFETKQFGTMHKTHPSLISAPILPSTLTEQAQSESDAKIEESIEDLIQPYSDPRPISPLQSSPKRDSSPGSEFRLVPHDYDSDDDSQPNDRLMNGHDGDQNDQVSKPSELPPAISEKHQNEETTADSKRRRRGGRRAAARRLKQQSGGIDLVETSSNNSAVLNLQQELQSNAFVKSSNSQRNPFASHPVVQLQAQRRRCLTNMNQIHSRPTLLQMLLAEDIRKERNQLMQCIRYVVKSNFFMDSDNKLQ